MSTEPTPTFTVKINSRKRIRMIKVVPVAEPNAEGEWFYLDDVVNIVARNWCELEAGLAKYIPDGHRLVAYETARY